MTQIQTFDRPFTFFGAQIGNRMTVIRLSDGTLWVHSPIAPTPDIQTSLRSLGKVAHIVCPNTFHHVHAKAFHETYSSAAVYGVPGLEEKLAPLPVMNLYDPGTSDISWANDILIVPLYGVPKVNEVVFYHTASKTVIVTDMIFNTHHKTGWTKLFLMLAGAHNKCGIDTVYRMMIKDKQQFLASVAPLLDVEVDRIVMSHGDVITQNATHIFRKAIEAIRA